MKIAVVGGGSTYSPELAEGLAHRARALGLSVLTLTDADPKRLEVVGGFTRRMVARIEPALEVRLESGPSGLEAALEGADFVVVQIRVGGQEARQKDELFGKRHGIVGQETTGVGGFRKAMRTVPALLEICSAMRRVCPKALLINFTNPVSIVTEAVLKHGGVRALGLCNIPIGIRMDLAKALGVEPARIAIDSVGLNHLSFVRKVIVDGEDVLPRLLGDHVARARDHRPANIPDLDYPAELVEALGMIPSDYLRYFYLQREMIAEQAAKPRTRAEEVMEIERELLATYADPNNSEKPPGLSKRGGAYYSHAAIEVIEAVVEDTGAVRTVDVTNGDTVRELPRDVVVEVPCRIDRAGATPLPQAPLEPAIRGLIQHVKSYEELAVTAAVEKSRRAALLALSAHPLVSSVRVAAELVRELSEELGLH